LPEVFAFRIYFDLRAFDVVAYLCRHTAPGKPGSEHFLYGLVLRKEIGAASSLLGVRAKDSPYKMNTPPVGVFVFLEELSHPLNPSRGSWPHELQATL